MVEGGHIVVTVTAPNARPSVEELSNCPGQRRFNAVVERRAYSVADQSTNWHRGLRGEKRRTMAEGSQTVSLLPRWVAGSYRSPSPVDGR